MRFARPIGIDPPIRGCRCLLTLALACGCLITNHPAAAQDLTAPTTWEAPEWGNRPLVGAGPEGGLSLTLQNGQGGAAITKLITVDLEATPILAVNVASLTPGASWELKVDNRPYDPAHPHDIQPHPGGGKEPGISLVDLRELGDWHGTQDIELRLFVLGPSRARVIFRRLTLLASTSPRAPDFPEGSAAATSGDWQLRYYASVRRFVINRAHAWGALTGVLPGGENLRALRVEPGAEGATVTIQTANDLAQFETHITAYNSPAGLFHWTVDAQWTQPHAVEAGGPECRYAIASPRPDAPEGDPLQVLSGHRFGQSGFETGQAYLPADAALGGTALYVENLSALNAYFQATHTSARETVLATPEGCGLRLPVDPKVVLPAGTHLRLIDTYLALTTADAVGPDAQAQTYLNLLAALYDAMPHPATIDADWQDLARRTLHDLLLPECWSNPEKGYLRNYVNEGATPNSAELIVQIDPLVVSLAYEQKWNRSTALPARIAPTLSEFYLPEIGCIHDSNVEKHPTRSDTWYRIYPLIQLARAAALGLATAKDLVRDSLASTIRMAHRCNYEFPVFYNPQTLSDFGYNEPDCAGAYAYLMLQSYDLFGTKSYLEEARAALKHLAWRGLNLSYEMHLTALSAAACARMWRATGEASYLQLSAIPVANLLRHCWLWEPRYGLHRDDHLFFGVSAMPGVYLSAFEEYQSWLALREYDRIAHDHLPYAVQDLVSEFIKYGPSVLRSTLPPLMTLGLVATTNDRGIKNDPNLLIPVEDVYDGWTQAGKIGQEIYGCGGPVAIANEAFTLVPEAGITVYSEYPVTSVEWNAQTHALRIRLGGVSSHDTRVVIEYASEQSGWKSVQSLHIQASGPIVEKEQTGRQLRVRVPGAQTLSIQPGHP